MFERFTDRARKVMQLANQEAQRFNHEYIGTEHILLGLVKEGSGVAADVLKNLDIDLHKIRLDVENIVQSGPDMVMMGKMPQTPRAKKVIEYSIEEARNFKHKHVGTDHLLLGLLREQEGIAAQVLMNLGLKLEYVREEILNLLDTSTNKTRGGTRPRAIPVEQTLKSGYGHLPAAVVQILKVIDDQMQQLELKKVKAVADQDFEKAASLREKEVQVEQQMLGVLKEINALLREFNDESK
jgi:ATP-dependent Clp protease ATP-binding subunit ClpC